jgi:hypothetical protein
MFVIQISPTTIPTVASVRVDVAKETVDVTKELAVVQVGGCEREIPGCFA